MVLVTLVDKRCVDENDKYKPNSTFVNYSKHQKAALVRERTVQDSKQMRIYHRLSVVAEKKQHVYSLKSEAGYSYDLVSVQPLNQETFDMACDAPYLDIIEVSIDNRLPYRITKKSVDNALQRGIVFEFQISSSFRDSYKRKNLFVAANALIPYTRGRNILLSCNPISPMELKAPHEYVSIARLMGLPFDKAYAVITKTVEECLSHGEKRRENASGVLIC
ncbi:hypothetical protein WA538_000528 [Blastocystis sp. DL]